MVSNWSCWRPSSPPEARMDGKGSQNGRSYQFATRSCQKTDYARIPCYTDFVHLIKRKAMNLTITVEDEVLKRARIRALEENTSVNAILREYLESYAGVAARRCDSLERLLRLSRAAEAGRGAAKWTRDELHER